MTQHKVRSADFGPTWPEVAGFGACPNKQFLRFDRRENLKNVQVSIHLPCLPVSETHGLLKFNEYHEDILFGSHLCYPFFIDGYFVIKVFKIGFPFFFFATHKGAMLLKHVQPL